MDATATLTAGSIVATDMIDNFTGPDALAAALAAVSETTGADSTARATLRVATLSRFRFHAARLSVEYQGMEILPSKLKGEAQSRVWRDATGEAKPVPAADRTPGETSMGQYLSRMATVATNVDYGGIAMLASVELIDETYETIKGLSAVDRERAAIVAAAGAAHELDGWLVTLPTSDQAKVDWVVKLFTSTSVGQSHVAAFAARLTVTTDLAETA